MKLSLIDALAIRGTGWTTPEEGDLLRKANQVISNHVLGLRRLHEIECKEAELVALQEEIKELKGCNQTCNQGRDCDCGREFK